MPGTRPTGAKHRDYAYKRQPTELNVWVPLTPTSASNTLWTESAPDAADFEPIEVAAFGEAVLFWGNQCEHYSLPNSTDTTRVSFDFRVIRGDMFTEQYVAPSSKIDAPRFCRGGAYTDTIAEARWRADLFKAQPDGLADPNYVAAPPDFLRG